LDQDDIWHNDHLEKLSRVFLEENSDRLGWVYSNVDQIDEQGKVFRSGLLNFCDFKHPQTQLEEMIKTDMHILPSASLIRKNALLDVALFDERLQGYEDDDLFLRLYAAGWKSRYLPQPLLKWRIHSGNSGSITGFKSRRIYAQKIIDDFSDTIGRNTAAEIVGARFFAVTLMFYKQALDLNDFQRCKWLHEDLKKYFKLSRQSLKKWKYRIPFMKYPQLIKLMLKIKQQLLHR
jgi:GT2 family glycosyltransferase